MSSKADYTLEEWREILTLATYVMAFKVEKAKKSIIFTGVIGLVKELFVGQSSAVELQKKYVDNELIACIIAYLKPEKAGEKLDFEMKLPNLEELVHNVDQTLLKKSDEKETAEYKAFVYELAYEICKAAGGGLLGLSENIDSNEAELLHRLKSCLLADS